MQTPSTVAEKHFEKPEAGNAGWGLLIPIVFIAFIAILAAGRAGPTGLEQLMYGSLMVVFLIGGVLAGVLTFQAAAARAFQFDDQQRTQQRPLSSKPAEPAAVIRPIVPPADEADDDVDPFVEILRRHSSRRRAA